MALLLVLILSVHPTVPHRTAVPFSAPAYAAPTIDDQLDALDGQREVARVAQEAAEAAEQVRVAAEAQKAPQRVIPPPIPRTAGDDWFYRIAVCETGHNPPTDEWRTGFFGIEAGYPVGGMGWDAELAWAKRIFADFGPGAWGCTGRVGYP